MADDETINNGEDLTYDSQGKDEVSRASTNPHSTRDSNFASKMAPKPNPGQKAHVSGDTHVS